MARKPMSWGDFGGGTIYLGDAPPKEEERDWVAISKARREREEKEKEAEIERRVQEALDGAKKGEGQKK